jgi:fatty acid desaturase
MEDVKTLRDQVDAQQAVIEDLRTRLTIAETEAKELKALRRAAFWLVGVVVAGAIGFGFSVLTFVHP